MHDMVAVAPEFEAELAREPLRIGQAAAQEVPVVAKQAMSGSISPPCGRVVVARVIAHDEEFGARSPGIEIALQLRKARHRHRTDAMAGGIRHRYEDQC